MKLAVAIGKVIVLAAWMWGLLSFVLPTNVPAPEIGRMVFLGLLAVHVAEALIFAKTLASEDGRPASSHVGKLLVFGYLHVLGVRYG
jgi:uncharacterized protein YhhL (DUF1145 family)